MSRELMQQAIEAMEYADACLKKQLTTKTKHEYAQDLLMEAGTALRERLAQPDPVAYWHSEFLKYNTTSDHRMMENAQGELERIKLVQTGVGIGKPEQEPVAWIDAFGNVFPLGAQRGPKHLNEPMKPLYTTPPQRKPLTEKRIEELYSFWVVDCQDIVGFARAVERTVKGEV